MSKQLGINPEMDELARKHNLSHWSCVSPLNGKLWVRSDGKEASTTWNDEKYIVLYAFETLKEMDSKYPIGKDWQQPTEIHIDLTEQEESNLLEMLRKNNTTEQLRYIVPVHEQSSKANKLLKIALGVINQFADYNDSTSAAKKDIENYLNDCLCDNGCEYHCTEGGTIPKKCKQPTLVSFKKLSLGARFRYTKDPTRIYVKIGSDLIAVWDKNNIDTTFMGQGIFSFSEDGNTDIDIELME